ncbi:carbohydrate ABC transporter permease [uncultured Sphaerochaeta sp.]|uniref:carbohydrate ABC transporter permease n=1 Tax=uncultured Sphaerochaeta sp. TaxID=886478 RepID=UPI002A0A49F7|nr:carbohydrate ABC transporter permease [uncultured Sphaerochaeta sp.]
MVKRKNFFKSLLFFLMIVAIVAFCIFPFGQMLSLSLKYSWDWGNPSWIPKKINLEAYSELLNIGTDMKTVPESVRMLLEESPDLTAAQKKTIIAKYRNTGDIFPFFKYFRNSALVSFIASFISVCFAIFGAYAFSRLKFIGRSVIQRGVLFVYMFGGILLLIPLYRILASLGFLGTPGGTMASLILVYVVQTLPVSLYMLGNYFRTIPYSIEEAAMIEGLSRFGTIIKIIIPLSIGAIFTVFIYCFMIAWNEYMFASVFLKSFKNLYTLPLGLKTLFVSKNAIWDRIMAASMMTAIPVMILFMSIQKNLTQGLSAGGVKE